MSQGMGCPIASRIPVGKRTDQKAIEDLCNAWAYVVVTMNTYHCSGVINHFLCGQIAFIANQQFIHIFACIAFDFLKPLLDIVEWFLVRAIIHNDDTVCAPIVWRRYLKWYNAVQIKYSPSGRIYMDVMQWNMLKLTVRKRSWPAVSQICSFIVLSSSSIVLILKSTPMVLM